MHSQDDDDHAPDVIDSLQPKRTTSFAARFKNKKKPGPPEAENDLVARIALEREKSKYWARILLLFPLAPVCMALVTILVGGVIINVATNYCDGKLLLFLQGAVFLSHILVCFYAYCWMGPWPIKRLRTVRIFYIIYGFICFVWWGIFGTLQASKATATGFQSCLSTSPALYMLLQYEVIIFWIGFLACIGYFIMERTAATRDAKLAERRKKKMEILRDKLKQEELNSSELRKEIQEKVEKQGTNARKNLENEQDDLFRESENEDHGNFEGDNQYDGANFDETFEIPHEA